MTFINSQSQRVEISTESLGRGGEGQVSRVVGAADLVAKIYHQPTDDQWVKTDFMLKHPVPAANGRLWVTWPVELLFTDDASPKFSGYLMPRLKRSHQLFTYYTPSLRQRNCPGFTYRHLVRSAHNVAAAFNLAHAHRYVIGDPNESNIFLNQHGFAILIDADSWQIVDDVSGWVYRSVVAKPELLPPELQNRNLSSIIRQPWHDNFSLAVLLFKLINEGTHPFDGIYAGGGEVPAIESRIAAGTFPYVKGAGGWRPKETALQFNGLHPCLQKLFLQAFVTGHRRPELRPNAKAWQLAFARAERDLKVCQQNSHHWFWGNTCVWCQRKRLLGGLDPFPGGESAVRRTFTATTPVAPIPVPVPQPPPMQAPPQPNVPRRTLTGWVITERYYIYGAIIAALAIILFKLFRIRNAN